MEDGTASASIQRNHALFLSATELEVSVKYKVKSLLITFVRGQ